MNADNILVVAFDGLDKELIDEYGLEEIKQEEYGVIDNRTGMEFIKTSELFASFITGKTNDEHGIVGLTNEEYESGWKESLINFISPKSKRKRVRGFYKIYQILSKLLRTNITELKYSRENLESDTLFEKIENSRPMYVPSYNPDPYFQTGAYLEPLGLGFSVQEVEKLIRERCFEPRKKNFFSELENDIITPRDFLMCHFHFSDFMHHFHADVNSFGGDEIREEKTKKMYNEMEEFSQEIKEKAEKAGYDYIIFMSDHGLPEGVGHNENAFYSCNKELFGDETPKITDFHDKILELTGNEDRIED